MAASFINKRVLKVVGSSFQEFFPPQLLILVDCDVILLFRPMEKGEEEDGDNGDGGRVILVFMMTLSRHFDFRDKASPSGEID